MLVPVRLFRNPVPNPLNRTGLLEISQTSVHFTAWTLDYAVTLPFVSVTRVDSHNEFTLRLTLRESRSKRIYLECVNDKRTAHLIKQLHRASQDRIENISPLSNNPVVQDPGWKEKQEYFRVHMRESSSEKAYRGKTQEVHKRWSHYLDYFGQGDTMIRTKGLQDLIMDGIPNTLRRKKTTYPIHTKNWN